MKKKIIIGRTDRIDLPELGIENIMAKIDTGAYTSALHCTKIKHVTEEGKEVLHITIPHPLPDAPKNRIKFKTSAFEVKKIKSSNGQVEERFVIHTTIKLFKRKYKTAFSLSDRSRMKNPILLGRKLLQGRFIVDVSEKDLSYKLKNS